MSNARRAHAERRAAIASRAVQTAPVGGPPHRSPSPAINAATGPAGNEQQASSLHPPVRRGGRAQLIDFDIVHIRLSYNAILGYPALAKFMAVTHHGYNVLKMPGS